MVGKTCLSELAMPSYPTRREFLLHGTAALAATGLTRVLHGPVSTLMAGESSPAPLFTISLAQWSLHKELFDKKIDNLDFARVTREEFGIDAVEYVNVFFKDKATDVSYLSELNRRAHDNGIYQHLIMCDAEGRLGDPDTAKRLQAVENHHKWVEAAHLLGCATIRVNAASEGSFEEQQKLAADGLRRLCEYADTRRINVVVENHGGLSSHGDWLAGVMRLVDHPRCGTLPDFGNFYEYDRYQGVQEMMPWAKAVSAKSHDFDADGNETTKDYRRLLRIVLDARFHTWVGIEYEGERFSEREGIRKTKALLERVRDEFTEAGKRPEEKDEVEP
jgi:sugar phosphate isomerase/epimerase